MAETIYIPSISFEFDEFSDVEYWLGKIRKKKIKKLKDGKAKKKS